MRVPTIVGFVPVKPRVRRKRRGAPVAAGPAALLLVQATWDPEEWLLVLHFDRAIDIAAIDGSRITVNDGFYTADLFDATGGAELVSETVLQLSMEIIDDASGSDVRLSAGAGNGIVAVDDGAAWGGAVDLVLPFP